MSEAFDSEAAKNMARALSLAMDRLSAGVTSGGADEARSILARAIIEAAEKGEHDPEKLAAYAIQEYKKTRGDGSSNGKSVN
jgi:hypothetical protein